MKSFIRRMKIEELEELKSLLVQSTGYSEKGKNKERVKSIR